MLDSWQTLKARIHDSTSDLVIVDFYPNPQLGFEVEWLALCRIQVQQDLSPGSSSQKGVALTCPMKFPENRVSPNWTSWRGQALPVGASPLENDNFHVAKSRLEEERPHESNCWRSN